MLATLHKVAYCYDYADANIFKKLRVFFVRAADERIRLWSFGLVGKELYIFDPLGSSIVPNNHVDLKQKLMDSANTMCDLKVGFLE